VTEQSTSGSTDLTLRHIYLTDPPGGSTGAGAETDIYNFLLVCTAELATASNTISPSPSTTSGMTSSVAAVGETPI